MRTPLACLWLLLAHLPAQVVHVGNLGASPYDGWVRATVDVMPEHKAGVTAGGVTWLLGREVGRDVRTVDLQMHLEAGELRSVDLAKSRALEFRRQPPPAPDEAGVPRVAGREMALVSILEDGAGYLVHLRARTGRLLCTDLWLVWFPGQAWARGEVVVTASNPAVPDVVETVPDGFALTWPNAVIVVQGAPAQGAGLLLASGETIADGQARSYPLTVAWPSRLGDAGPAGVSGWSSAGAAAVGGIAANGIARLYPEGTPAYAGDALAWTRQHRAAAIERLGGWQDGPLGVAAYSGRTGAQDDQVWPLGVAMAGQRSLGAEQVGYLVAPQAPVRQWVLSLPRIGCGFCVRMTPMRARWCGGCWCGRCRGSTRVERGDVVCRGRARERSRSCSGSTLGSG